MNGSRVNRAGAPPCSWCENPAVYRSRTTGKHFCADHFLPWFEGNVRETISASRMVEDGDRIAVALSGGKDSSVLLAVLEEIIPEYDGVSLVAITVDEGISGYRNDTIASAVSLTRRLGVFHRILSFRDLCGKNLDELVQGREQVSCSICGTLRRRALNILARGEGATKIATGHCLDDESQSVLMNYLRGDLRRALGRLGPEASRLFIPRIKPLRYLPEREVMVYGMLRDLVLPLPECPYTRYALRADVRKMLGEMEYRYPGTMMNVLTGQERLTRTVSLPAKASGLTFCHDCGEPATGALCATCTLLRSLGIGHI